MKTQTEETKAVMYAGLPGHTIGIKLFNPEDQSVLYVDEDPHGHQLTCEICNLAERGLTIPKGAGEPGPKNYHFAICFRKGILAIESVNSSNPNLLPKVLLDSDTGWKMSEAKIEEHRIVFYFLNQGDPIQLEPRDLLNLTLTGLRADAKIGVRTTRVELLYRQLYYTSNPDGILNGTRLHLLNIINHLGHQTSPIRIEWHGSHQVLNNGEKNTLLLKVTNTMKDRDLIFDEKASLVFWYLMEDIEDHQKLVEDNLAITLKVIDLDGKKLSIDFGKTDSNVRALEFVKSGIEKLEKHSTMMIQLEISTGLPAGISELYINQEGLRGYWNHSFTLPVEKTPMVFFEDKVGIGMNKPGAELDIRSTTKKPESGAELEIISKTSGAKEVRKGAIAIFSKSMADNTGALQLGIEKEYSWIQSHKAKPLMINPAGNNVGIGTEKAKEKLEVKGNINVIGKVKENGHDLIPSGCIMMWSGEEDKVPDGWLLCNGDKNTPNLIDRFIMGGPAKKFNDKDPKMVNGSNEMTLEPKHLPDHSHFFIMKAGPSPKTTLCTVTEWVLQPIKPERKEKYHNREYHTSTSVTERTSKKDGKRVSQKVVPFDNRPQFYTLAFIMKK